MKTKYEKKVYEKISKNNLISNVKNVFETPKIEKFSSELCVSASTAIQIRHTQIFAEDNCGW